MKKNGARTRRKPTAAPATEAGRATARKATTRKAPSRKAPSRKAPTRKATTRKAPTRKAPTRKAPAGPKTAGVGDAAVRAKTGKTWSQWIRVLDRAGARSMPHRDIAKLLHEEHRLPGWWAQMVTVGYEQARGLRQKHQKSTGYEVSGSKTVGVRVAKLYRAFTDARTRRRWLPDDRFEVRKATKEKSMRITWSDGRTHVDAYFYPKGAEKSQIAIQHKKLRDAREAAHKKKFWAGRLAELKSVLEA